MDTVRIELTVYFEDPFWVGVFTRDADGGTEAARHVFGAEPRDAEVYRLLLDGYCGFHFSPRVAGARRATAFANPKRLQRMAARRMTDTGAGTKAQQALQMQREQGKRIRKTESRQLREKEEERKYLLRQERRRQKHKGR